MRLTEEQKLILNSSGNLKIHAVAGSGKTTTLVEYARKHGKKRRILYLAFNRSVKIEAQKRFAQAELSHVQVDTAHSLAWNRIVPEHGYKVRSNYKPHEIADLLKIKHSNKDPVSSIALCSHIGKLISLFCNQAVSKVKDMDYSSYIDDLRAKNFVTKHHDKIADCARKLLAMMNAADIAVTHEFYLKKFQLSRPQLYYDIILFDEGQDASPVMLDIFLNQTDSLKIIVGDIHQQIYSWRYAVNALKNVNFTDFSLTSSFRFPQYIADVAMSVLQWKKYLKDPLNLKITGLGKNIKRASSKITLARTNLSLLRRAIEYTNSSRTKRKIYFEGNLSSYMYAAEGASLWDVLNLYQGKFHLIKDPLIKQMKTMDDLQEYAEVSNDSELSTLIEMVNEHGLQLPSYINKIKEMHVEDKDRDKADMIFSTVHRSKGLEYDSVNLENDFISEKKLLRVAEKSEIPRQDLQKLNEEINLLYVAVTRSRGILKIPQGLFLDNTPLIQELHQKSSSNTQQLTSQPYIPWTHHDDEKLRHFLSLGETTEQIALKLKRSKSSVTARIRKLGIRKK